MDKEVLREIWHGQLPLCFKLHQDDVSGMHRPEPYYMMVSRVTYFPLVLDRVVKYFNRFRDQDKQAVCSDMWLDYEGQPVKMHHPIGLSWDLLGSSYDLPWKLILHFSDFPAKELLRCNTKSFIETNFMSSIKEADALKHKGLVIKNMIKKDHNQLWSSLVNDKFDQFWAVNKRLMDRTDNELFRYIPYRLYFPDYTYVQKVVKPCTTERQIFFNSENETNINPVPHDTDIMMYKTHKCSHTSKPNNDDQLSKEHRCTTLLDLIQITFNNRMNDLLLSESILNEQPKEDPISETNETPSSAQDYIDVRLFKYRFIIHGIEIPFDTPLQWLSEHLSFPDNFLHICAVIKDEHGYL